VVGNQNVPAEPAELERVAKKRIFLAVVSPDDARLNTMQPSPLGIQARSELSIDFGGNSLALDPPFRFEQMTMIQQNDYQNKRTKANTNTMIMWYYSVVTKPAAGIVRRGQYHNHDSHSTITAGYCSVLDFWMQSRLQRNAQDG
jgi:hypothetical protein